MRRRGFAAVLGFAALALPGGAMAAPLPSPVPTSFTVRSLEPQPGDNSGGAAGLNNWGDAVGWSDFGGGPARATLF
jgi:hypothetical protein